MRCAEMGRLDFVGESTYVIFAEVDMYQTLVCLKGVPHHSIVMVLVSDVEYVFTESLQHFLAKVHNIEECWFRSFLHCHLVAFVILLGDPLEVTHWIFTAQDWSEGEFLLFTLGTPSIHATDRAWLAYDGICHCFDVIRRTSSYFLQWLGNKPQILVLFALTGLPVCFCRLTHPEWTKTAEWCIRYLHVSVVCEEFQMECLKSVTQETFLTLVSKFGDRLFLSSCHPRHVITFEELACRFNNFSRKCSRPSCYQWLRPHI